MRSRRVPAVLAVANPVSNMGPSASEAAIPPELASPGLSLLQIYSILRAFRVQALIIAVMISLCTGVLLKFTPKTYSAPATLMVTPEGDDPLGAAATPNATPFVNYMATEAQLMVSPEVMLPLIDQLKLAEDPAYTGGAKGDPAYMRERIREQLAKNLEIRLGESGSQLIYINAFAANPQLAAQIANTLADVYLSQQRQRVSGPASERARRYAAELAELKNKVRIAQDEVTAFRQRTGVTDTTEKNGNLEQALLGNLETKLQDAQNARRAAEVKQMGSSPDAGGPSTSPVVQQLRSALNVQRSQLADLRTTLGVQHPKVRELQSQIDATQANLDHELQNVNSDSSAELVAARQLEGKLRAAVEEQRNKVLTVNRMTDEGTKYMLELESAQSVYKRALDGYDQIMFASGGRAANISVVSSAIPPQSAAKPNKVRLMVLGTLAGVLLGLLAPLCYELLVNRRVRCRDDFERGFDVPVLMEFEPILFARITQS